MAVTIKLSADGLSPFSENSGTGLFREPLDFEEYEKTTA
jgi:hypothetical protein